jgi:hypothetical protein
MTKNANIPNKHGAPAPEVQPRAVVEEKTETVKVEKAEDHVHEPAVEKGHKHHHTHHHKEEEPSAAPVI